MVTKCHLVTKVFTIQIFFIHPPLILLPVLGPLEGDVTPTLDGALLL